MEKRIILALDPGETTGYAVCSVADSFDSFTLLSHGVLVKWQGIQGLINFHKPTVIVVEKFLLYPHLAKVQAFSTLVASRVLGAIEYIAELNNLKLVEQSASSGKSYVPQGVYDLMTKRATPHEKDALRHAVSFCYRIGVKE